MKIDGRTLSHETSDTLRRLAVRRVKAGDRLQAVMKSFGLCRTTIYKWLSAVKRSGNERSPRARIPGLIPSTRPNKTTGPPLD